MSDETPICPGFRCEHPLRDEYLCRSCQRRAERVLGDLVACARDVEVTVTRQDRITNPGKRGTGHAQPSPANLNADRQARTVFDLLFEWADHVAQWQGVRGLPVFAAHRPLTEMVAQACAILLQYSDWMRNQQQGPDLANAIHSVRRDARRIVDQPATRLYAGPCQADLGYPPELGYGCRLPLFRKWGADDIECDGHNPELAAKRIRQFGCGTVHLAVERDGFMVAAAEEHVLPLRLLYDSLHVLIPNCALDWKTVHQWTKARQTRVPLKDEKGRQRFDSRGRERVRIIVTPPRLTPVRVDSDGRELYRGADVLALARDGDKRRGRRRVARVERMSA